MKEQQPSVFKELLNAMMRRRWYITALVLGGFMLIIAGMFAAIGLGTPMAAAWKELLMLKSLHLLMIMSLVFWRHLLHDTIVSN